MRGARPCVITPRAVARARSMVPVAVAAGAVDVATGQQVVATLDRLEALTYGLWRGAA